MVFTFSAQNGRFGWAAADEESAGSVTRTCWVLQCTEGRSVNISESLCAHFHHLFDWCCHIKVGNVPIDNWEWKITAQQEAKPLCRSLSFHHQICLQLSSWLGVSKAVRCWSYPSFQNLENNISSEIGRKSEQCQWGVNLSADQTYKYYLEFSLAKDSEMPLIWKLIFFIGLGF